MVSKIRYPLASITNNLSIFARTHTQAAIIEGRWILLFISPAFIFSFSLYLDLAILADLDQ